MSTFAIPNEKRGTTRSLFLRFSRRKNQKETSRKFIEKTETVQEASTEKIQFIEKR